MANRPYTVPLGTRRSSARAPRHHRTSAFTDHGGDDIDGDYECFCIVAEAAISVKLLLCAHWGTVGASSGMPVAVAEQVPAVADGLPVHA